MFSSSLNSSFVPRCWIWREAKFIQYRELGQRWNCQRFNWDHWGEQDTGCLYSHFNLPPLAIFLSQEILILYLQAALFSCSSKLRSIKFRKLLPLFPQTKKSSTCREDLLSYQVAFQCSQRWVERARADKKRGGQTLRRTRARGLAVGVEKTP